MNETVYSIIKGVHQQMCVLSQFPAIANRNFSAPANIVVKNDRRQRNFFVLSSPLVGQGEGP